jgi:hypothetical protein
MHSFVWFVIGVFMNVKPVFFTPKNDEELNAYIESINDSYAKGFNFHVGPKRSEKLRDVICSHLGFPNGYQQLKSHWDNPGVYDVLDNPGERGLMVYADAMGKAPAAIVFNEIAPWLLDKLRELFPCTENGFDREDDTPTLGRKGWVIAAYPLKSEGDLVTWVPLYVGTVQIGYANAYKSRHRAMIMQAMVTGVHMHIGDEMRAKLNAPINPDWHSYISSHAVPERPCLDRVVSLRMDSMQASLLIPIEGEIVIASDELKFKAMYSQENGAGIVKNCYIDAKKGYPESAMLLDGIAFDFVSVYDFSDNPDENLNVACSKMTIKYIENKAEKIVLVDSLEWCEHGRVEVREDEAFYGIDLCSGITVRVL